MHSPAPGNNSWLALLRDLAQLLEQPRELEQCLEQALQLLARELGMSRGAITLVSPSSGRIRIHASYGLNPGQRKLGDYAPGEGITGHVIATGQSMRVADLAKEPLFLNRTNSRDPRAGPFSLLCVPIKAAARTVGAIWIDQPARPAQALDEELALLEIAASLLAHVASESRQETAEAPQRPQGFIGNSQIMRQIYEQISIVAPSGATVCLQGESGTGKELAARAIHLASANPSGPFVSLNCAALPESLIESEIFGHEKGAFTGASQMRRGRFELANGGTLFLDEVGELSPLVQAKLLRVIQERVFERVGGNRPISLNARLITATNRDLGQMAEAGLFRRDLYYRLNVFPIHLPPLRERREDIPALAAHHLRKFGLANGKKAPRLSLAALDAMQRYAWPGNIRELQNALERAALLCGAGGAILPQHLPEEVRASAAPARQHSAPGSLADRLEEVERACIVDALTESGGRLNRAAARLGLTERIMGLRLKKYGLNYKSFRQPGQASSEEP